MQYEFDACVFIGRFQPLHQGHVDMIQHALEKGRHVIVLVGSAYQARSTRNPFTYEERKTMIKSVFPTDRVIVKPVRDSNYNLNAWIERVHATVEHVMEDLNEHKPTIALVGHDKDETTYYLNLFPSWGAVALPSQGTISGTSVRESLFSATVDFEQPAWAGAFVDQARQNAMAYLETTSELPRAVAQAMGGFVHTPMYVDLANEFAFVKKYQHAWRLAPYKPTFVTVDAVVVQSGHVLLVRRNQYPGKGLWALPGGFVEPMDTLEEACLRELSEETGIRVPKAVLRGHIQKSKVFDAPHRSSRGRTLTHAFLIDLGTGALPALKRDKEETQGCRWARLADLNSEDFFEDHYQIIRHMTNTF